MARSRADGSALPETQPHHHDAKGHPSEDPDGDNRFKADPPRGFFCMSLGDLFLHGGTSSGRIGGCFVLLLLVARVDQARPMP